MIFSPFLGKGEQQEAGDLEEKKKQHLGHAIQIEEDMSEEQRERPSQKQC